MSELRIDLTEQLVNGQSVTFQAPCDCTEITAMKVYYPGESGTENMNFIMKDAHGNVLTSIGNLFAQGAYVHAILDTNYGFAYLQNADTNGYLESRMSTMETNLSRVSATPSGEIGEIYCRKDATHSTGISFNTLNDNTFPEIYIDGTPYSLIPNNKAEQGNNKILDVKVDYSKVPWELAIDVYIDGTTYTQYLSLSDRTSSVGRLQIVPYWLESSNGYAYVSVNLSTLGISGSLGDFPCIMAMPQINMNNTNSDVYVTGVKAHDDGQTITVFLNKSFSGGLTLALYLLVQ